MPCTVFQQNGQNTRRAIQHCPDGGITSHNIILRNVFYDVFLLNFFFHFTYFYLVVLGKIYIEIEFCLIAN